MTLKFILFFALVFGLSEAHSQTTTILAKKYSVTNQSGTTYIENFTRTQAQIAYQYKLTIKNADGVDRLQKNCSGLTFIARLLCVAENALQQAYLNIFRVNSAVVTINNVALTTTSTFTKNTRELIVPLTVEQTNQLKIIVAGNILSFVNIKLESISVQTDTTAPTQLANIQSNTITKNPLIYISITDNSATTTYIWNNLQELLLTTTEKEFDINLTEGLNNFVIQSKDIYNNTSSYLYLTNITLDTTPPDLNLTLASEYIYSTYPQNFTLNITSNEDLQSLTINNIAATLVAPKTYSAVININSPQTLTLDLKAFDLAGNEKIQTSSVIFGQDNTPPAITSSLASNSFTNINTFQIQVSDNASFVTEVYSNNELILTTSEASFNLSLQNGLNNFIIKSKDQYGNEAPNLILSNITLDTVIPSLTYTNIFSPYYTSIIPDSGYVEFRFNEPLKELLVDGQIVLPDASRNNLYTYLKVIPQTGIVSIVLKATDLAGNIRNRTFNINVILDNQAPQIFLVGGIPQITSEDSYLLSVVISDQSQTTTTISVNGTELSSVNLANFTYLINLPTDGKYDLVIRSEDRAGNSGALVLSIIKKKDQVAPVITSNIEPSYTVASLTNSVQLQFTSNEALKSFKVDGEIVTSDSLVYNFTKQVSQIGSNQVTIEATDLSDNVKTETYSFDVSIDDLAPEIQINLTNNYTDQNSILLPISITEDSASTTDISVNGDFLATVSEKDFSYLISLPTDGVYNILITSSDAAGNISSQSLSVTRDTQPVLLQVQSPQAGSIFSTQLIEVRFSANKIIKKAFVNNIEVALNADQKSVTYQYSSFNDGLFSVNLKVEDHLGRISEQNVEAEIRIGGSNSWTYEECPVQE